MSYEWDSQRTFEGADGSNTQGDFNLWTFAPLLKQELALGMYEHCQFLRTYCCGQMTVSRDRFTFSRKAK